MSSLSTVHFLKFPENSFRVLKLLENSVEVLKILENKLESMRILENKFESLKLQENQPVDGLNHREEEDQEGNNSPEIETLTYHVLATYGCGQPKNEPRAENEPRARTSQVDSRSLSAQAILKQLIRISCLRAAYAGKL
ncbi:hypothetical protein Tco_0204731 [Tanacetum coccineum]